MSGIWVNHKHYSSWAEYHAQNPTPKVRTQEVSKPVHHNIPSVQVSITPPTYAHNLPPASRPVQSNPIGNIFHSVVNTVTNIVKPATTAVTHAVSTVTNDAISRIKKLISDLTIRITKVENKVDTFVQNIPSDIKKAEDRLSTLEHTVSTVITKDITTIEDDITTIYKKVGAQVKKDEKGIVNLISKVSDYVVKVYDQAKKDINNVEIHLKNLLKEAEHSWKKWAMLYLETMFPFLFIAHLLNTKFVEFFVYWITNLIEKLLFDL